MPPYIINLYIDNRTKVALTPSDPSHQFYNGNLDGQDKPNAIAAQQHGFAAKMNKTGGSQGLYGLVAYNLPDDTKKLVIWCQMPQETGTITSVRVGVFSKTKDLSKSLVGELSDKSGGPERHGLRDENTCSWENEKGKYFLNMKTNVKDPHNTTTDVTVYLTMDEILVPEPPPEEGEGDPRFTPIVSLRDKVADSTLFKIAAGPLHKFGQPVHEDMTLAALISAGIVDRSVTYEKAYGGFAKTGIQDVWEFIRGVIWNDDPACQLFNNDANYNNSFSTSIKWLGKFEGIDWKGSNSNIIHRSHFGDLQWLHSMAAQKGEAAQKTQGDAIHWIEVMYKLSVADGVSERDRIDSQLSQFFNERTQPKGSQTLRDLLVGSTTSYTKVMTDRRALGSCFHLIQDSYAIGHCQRTIINKEDLGKATFTYDTIGKIRSALPQKLFGSKQKDMMKFPKDHPGRFSDIRNFHSYKNQDDHRHGAYDKAPNPEKLDPTYLESFNETIGARDAIDKCTQLAKYWKEKKKWEGDVKNFVYGVFKLADGATASNIEVDPEAK